MTIVDLRQEEEIIKKPCIFSQHPSFTYYNIPITGGNRVPATEDGVVDSYCAMLDKNMWNTIYIIEHATTNVLFYCNAGKDRTGVVSAILLSRIGRSREEIIKDYTESYDNLKVQLEAYTKENPSINIQIITPKREYMEKFLDYYEHVRN